MKNGLYKTTLNKRDCSISVVKIPLITAKNLFTSKEDYAVYLVGLERNRTYSG